MRRSRTCLVIVSVGWLTLAPLALSACHAPTTIQTPAGQIAYTADQIVLRVNELQSAAIAAEAAQQLPTATTRTIVTFCVAANRTLATTPTGWAATLATAWGQTKAQLGPITNPAVAAAIHALDVVLAIQGV